MVLLFLHVVCDVSPVAYGCSTGVGARIMWRGQLALSSLWFIMEVLMTHHWKLPRTSALGQDRVTAFSLWVGVVTTPLTARWVGEEVPMFELFLIQHT